MIDPIVLGLALSAVAVVVAVIFYLFSGGDNFDKVYNEQAKQLLTGGEKEKAQSKKKSVKRKDVKDKKTDVSDKGSETSSVVEQESKTETVEKVVKQPTEQKTEVTTPTEENKDAEGKKKKNKKTKAKTAEVAQVEEVAPVETAKPAPVVVQEASPKKAKKTKTEKKKEEEIDNSDWIPASKKEKSKKEAKEQESKVAEVAQKTTPTPPPSPASEVAEKVEAPKVETVAPVAAAPAFAPEVLKTLEQGPLDLQKVLKAFSADPILAKYADFIKNFADEKNKQNNLAAEALTKTFEQKRAEFDRSTATLNAQHEQVTRKLASEKTELAEQVARLQQATETARVVAEETYRRAESAEKELQNRTLALNAALAKQANVDKQSTHQTDALRGLENQVAELKKELAAAAEYKNKVNETTDEYDKLVADLKEEADAQLQAKETELQKLQDEKAELNKKTMEQYLEIQALVEKLNAEVPKFEEMKKELEEKNKKFDEQVKKLTQLEEAHNKMKTENDNLRDQVLELTKKLNTSSASTTKDDAGEEIIVLSKTNHLQSAPPSQVSQEEVALREQNTYLTAKNEELRERNFKLLAHLETVEGKEGKATTKPEESKGGVEERTKAIAVLKNLPEASAFAAPSPNDCDAYATWLANIDKALKSAHKKDGKKNKDKKSAEPSGDAEKYKHALSLLEGELSHIESLMNEKEARYEDRIRKLEEQLKSSRGAIVKKKEAVSDHSADELGWEVI